MGADGGSIPDRRDLVKNKTRATVTDGENIRRAQWLLCALSKRPLREPIVLDSLGKMYNKDAILEFLLDRSSVGDGESICGHVKSIKDLVTLNLTMNPKLAGDAKQEETTDTQAPTPLFICPLTQREANGLIPFVAIRTSGDVFSEAGLKAVTKDATSGGLPSPPPEDVAPVSSEKDKAAACRIAISPTSGTPFNATFQGAKSTEDMTPTEGAVVAQKALASDLIYINPPASLQEDLRIAIALNQAEAKATKKGKKRKSAAAGAFEEEPSKKSKQENGAAKAVAATTEPSRAQALAKAVSKDLKEAEEHRKRAGMSAAVQSLYKKKGEKEDDNYMTRGTFTRFA